MTSCHNDHSHGRNNAHGRDDGYRSHHCRTYRGHRHRRRYGCCRCRGHGGMVVMATQSACGGYVRVHRKRRNQDSHRGPPAPMGYLRPLQAVRAMRPWQPGRAACIQRSIPSLP
eukprot:gene19729-biopygen16074